MSLLYWRIGTIAVILVLTWAAALCSRVDRDRVWIVGTDNTLPYHALISTDGGPERPTGMMAELMVEAAQRIGVKLQWKRTVVKSLSEGKVDLWPGNTAALSNNKTWVTRPIIRQSIVLVGRVDGQNAFSFDVAHPRLTMRGSVAPSSVKLSYPGSALSMQKNRPDALHRLCTGEADGLLIEDHTLQALMLNRPEACRGMELAATGSLLASQELGFGSTAEASPVANLLRAEVDAMIAQGASDGIARKWAYFSGAELDVIYRQSVAMRERQISTGLSLILFLFTIGLSILFFKARRAQKEAMEANAAKNDFLANISHEIRTPLNGILGLAEVLSVSALDGKQRELLVNIDNSGRNLLAIVNDVLDLAQVTRGRFTIRPEPVELRRLFVEVTPAFSIAARNKKLDFELEGLETLPAQVSADPVRLRQVFINLVGNAIKFTEAGSVRVQFSSEMEGDASRIRIAVRDTGIGISEEARRRLFQKFYQADSSISRRFGGTGLGLSIVNEIVKAMGGSVELTSEEGKGSEFTVTLSLPLLKAEPKGEFAVPDVVEPARRIARVLVMEDNDVNQIVVRSFLERAGHEVVCASDGESGLMAWKEGGFDLILMDCQMPNLDGFETAARIRDGERAGPRVPIIALTASAMQGEREKCIEAGMDDFLSKPVRSKELLDVVNTWITEKPLPVSTK